MRELRSAIEAGTLAQTAGRLLKERCTVPEGNG